MRGAQAHTRGQLLSPPPPSPNTCSSVRCVPLAYVCASYLATRVDRLRHVAFVNATEDALGLRQSLALVVDLCRRNERRVRHCSLLLPRRSWEKEEPRKERQRAHRQGVIARAKHSPHPTPHAMSARGPLPMRQGRAAHSPLSHGDCTPLYTPRGAGERGVSRHGSTVVPRGRPGTNTSLKGEGKGEREREKVRGGGGKQ